MPQDQLTRTVDNYLANQKSGNTAVAMSVNQPSLRPVVHGGPSVRPIPQNTPLHPPAPRFFNANMPRQGTGGAVNFSPRCHHCGTLGHLKRQCPNAAQAQQAQPAQGGVRRVAVQDSQANAAESTDRTPRSHKQRQYASISNDMTIDRPNCAPTSVEAPVIVPGVVNTVPNDEVMNNASETESQNANTGHDADTPDVATIRISC